MSIKNQRGGIGTTSDPTPLRTPADVGTVTPRVTPLGRSPTSDELYASGRKAKAETWSPSTKPVRTRE